MEINKIYCGDSLEVLKRDSKGRFIKGINYYPAGNFKKGWTRRKPRPYWNKEWLHTEYVNKKTPANQIAKEQDCTENNILFWLHKHNIKIRTIKEVREIKYWGLCGNKNGMYGKTGKQNPNWNGGHSPERQSMYARSVWKELSKFILKRDGYTCRKCNSKHTSKAKLNVHHKKEWSKYPELRFEPTNLIVLCEECHKNEHRKN